MTPVVVPVADLQPVQPGEIDVGRQSRPAVQIIQASAADQPDGHVIKRGQRLERASGFVAQPRIDGSTSKDASVPSKSDSTTRRARGGRASIAASTSGTMLGS